MTIDARRRAEVAARYRAALDRLGVEGRRKVLQTLDALDWMSPERYRTADTETAARFGADLARLGVEDPGDPRVQAARNAIEAIDAHAGLQTQDKGSSAAMSKAANWTQLANQRLADQGLTGRRDWESKARAAAEAGQRTEYPGGPVAWDATTEQTNRQEDDVSVIDKVREVFRRDETADYPAAEYPTLTAAEASQQLAARGYDEDEARRMVADYQADTSSRLGIPADLLGLDRNDLDAMARGRDEQRYAEAAATARDDTADEANGAARERDAYIENDARKLADTGEYDLDTARAVSRRWHDSNDAWVREQRDAAARDGKTWEGPWGYGSGPPQQDAEGKARLADPDERGEPDEIREARERAEDAEGKAAADDPWGYDDDTRQADAGGDDTTKERDDMSTDNVTGVGTKRSNRGADAAPAGDAWAPDAATRQQWEAAENGGKRDDSGKDDAAAATATAGPGMVIGDDETLAEARVRNGLSDDPAGRDMTPKAQHEDDKIRRDREAAAKQDAARDAEGKADAAARAAAADSGAAVAAADATDDKPATAPPSGDAWDDRDADAKGRRRDDADY